MLIADLVKIPTGISLGVIAVILLLSVITSFVWPAAGSEVENVVDAKNEAAE